MALTGTKKDSKNTTAEMSFWGHIEALRGHIIRSVIAVLSLAVVLFCFPEFLFDTIIFGPIDSEFLTYRAFCKLSHILNIGDQLCFGKYSFKLQSLGLADQFTSQMWISFLGGVIVGAPYLLWELFRFIKPALKDTEKRASTTFIITSSFLFITGVLFSYFVIVPLSVNFLGNYKVSEMVENNFTMASYISLVTTLTIATGIVFELPIIVYFLTRFGILTPEFMRNYRRHAVVVILVAAGIITPSPDITSQMLVAFPLYFLYEASIFVSAFVVKQNRN